MTLALLSIILAICLLVWSADKFVSGASAVAKHWRVPSLLIGMVILGYGTSAPEMIVSVLAAYEGNPELALGNAYGSNITNIGLILGLVAIIAPISVHSKILKAELPALLSITFISLILLWDGNLSRLDGSLLLTLFLVFILWSIQQSRRRSADSLAADMDCNLIDSPMPFRTAALWLLLGLITLILASRLLIWGAVSIANRMGLSELIVGLTIIAIGTSLPELASSLMAARKREHDLALGNVIGSNFFNTLAVVGLATMFNPIPVDEVILRRDMPVMILFTLALFLSAYGFVTEGRLGRWRGSLMFFGYVIYMTSLVLPVLAR